MKIATQSVFSPEHPTFKDFQLEEMKLKTSFYLDLNKSPYEGWDYNSHLLDLYKLCLFCFEVELIASEGFRRYLHELKLEKLYNNNVVLESQRLIKLGNNPEASKASAVVTCYWDIEDLTVFINKILPNRHESQNGVFRMISVTVNAFTLNNFPDEDCISFLKREILKLSNN
jgi:hypothetical protein